MIVDITLRVMKAQAVQAALTSHRCDYAFPYAEREDDDPSSRGGGHHRILYGMSVPACDFPALLGGAAVRPEGPPTWPPPDDEVRAALLAAIDAGAWGQYYGENIPALEAELASFHNLPHALTCSSGTLAVEVALRALGVAAGDEVVLAAYDYESNFLTVHALGARPVLIDIHPRTWQLDPANLKAAISARTKAIICSHLHGGIVPMGLVMEIARPRGIGVIEDAAQAAGATVEGRAAGTWGDAGILSFGGSKLLAAGRGGALLFHDAQLFQRAKLWLQRGLQQWAPLSELQAAALRPQLRKLPEMTRRRADNVRELFSANPDREGGGGVHPLPHGRGSPGLAPGLNIFPCTVPNSRPAFYKLGFNYDPAAFGLARERFVAALRAEGIAFDTGFKALHVGRSPSRFRAACELTHASLAHERCVVLHHPVLSLSRANVLQVAEAVAKTYRFRDALAAPIAPARR